MRLHTRHGLAITVPVVLVAAAIVVADGSRHEGQGSMTPETQPVRPNQLIDAASPYLLQHAHNPVDWHPWGPEALRLARAQNKPIFLSIGYAACHWCHVMAHESFEDPEIAAVMNEHFINIKVDREERPDLDGIYMQATLVLNQGQGGWPMSVWLTPELKPFFAGTYFPPTSRYGRPGFKDVCQRIGEAWVHERDKIEQGAAQLTAIVRESLTARTGDETPLMLEAVDAAAQTLASAIDSEDGGLLSGGSNKFPPSMALDLLLRAAARRPADDDLRRRSLQLVSVTLDRMAHGGIYDQLGGGVHRYSTDPQWHVPHFEKMLYDQALVSRAYLDAWQLLEEPLYRRVAGEILDYVLRDLRSPQGGFYSSRDADSEGVEGKYYVWTRDEILEILGPEDGELFCACYDVRENGNWSDPHDPATPKNILRIRRDDQCCAKFFSISREQFHDRLGEARRKMLAAREKRVAPGLDDKILVEWNGLMIASLARGGTILDEPRYTQAAAAAAEFVLERQYVDGRLRRTWRDGRRQDSAFLSDYACFIEGLLELYEATFERNWLERAVELNRVTIERFWDDEAGGFFFTADDHDAVIARTKDVRDSAHPSGNSVMLMNLLRLAVITGDAALRDKADRMIHVFSDEVRRAPYSTERFLAGVDFAHAGPVEIAIVGDPAQEDTQALLRRVYATYLPNRVLMLMNSAGPRQNPDSPLLEGRALVDGRSAAYVCRDYACRQPVTTPAALAEQLANR